MNAQNTPQGTELLPDAAYLLHRGVKHLYHFTQFSNLASILKDGLMSRHRLDVRQKIAGESYAFNDFHRYDEKVDTTSLSVSFPNYSMFYKCRKSAPSNARWVVLELDVMLLNNLPHAYYPTNAATGRGKVKRVPVNKFFGNRKDIYPEDKQAEIMVSGVIPRKYITKVYLSDDLRTSPSYDQVKQLVEESGISGSLVKVNNELFSYRKVDYR